MLFADNIYKINIHAWIHLQCCPLDQSPPLLPYSIYSTPLLHELTAPLTYLEIPFLVIVVRMSIHSRRG